jgi:hypothetical protein
MDFFVTVIWGVFRLLMKETTPGMYIVMITSRSTRYGPPA